MRLLAPLLALALLAWAAPHAAAAEQLWPMCLDTTPDPDCDTYCIRASSLPPRVEECRPW